MSWLFKLAQMVGPMTSADIPLLYKLAQETQPRRFFPIGRIISFFPPIVEVPIEQQSTISKSQQQSQQPIVAELEGPTRAGIILSTLFPAIGGAIGGAFIGRRLTPRLLEVSKMPPVYYVRAPYEYAMLSRAGLIGGMKVKLPRVALLPEQIRPGRGTVTLERMLEPSMTPRFVYPAKAWQEYGELLPLLERAERRALITRTLTGGLLGAALLGSLGLLGYLWAAGPRRATVYRTQTD